MSEEKTCNCDICKLSRKIQSISKKCDEEEKEALNVLWNRCEGAETELAVRKAKEEGTWPSDDEYPVEYIRVGAMCPFGDCNATSENIKAQIIKIDDAPQKLMKCEKCGKCWMENWELEVVEVTSQYVDYFNL